MKLVKNFRSHPAILAFSNSAFYDDELEACGHPAITHSLLQCPELVTKGFPLIFHGIIGKDEQEKSSPSFFNIDEATQVKKYCLSLIENKKNHLSEFIISVLKFDHALIRLFVA